MIKVAINASMLDDTPRGLGVYTINMINNLVKISHDNVSFTVYSPTTQGLDKEVNIIHITKYVTSKYGKIGALVRFLWNQIILTLKGRSFDFVYCPTQHGSLFLRNQIVTIHDLISLEIKDINKIQRFYFNTLGRLLISKSLITIAISNYTKTDIINKLKVPPSKVVVIHNGLDFEKFNTKLVKESKIDKYLPYLLAVGPTYPHKNFERLIKAFNIVYNNKYKLLISGGSEPYLSSLKGLVAKMQNKNIIFLGYVDNNKLVDLYQNAHLFVYPSLYEGFGMPNLEAMAAGTLVVTSNTSSIPEICGDGVIYFTPTNQNDIVEKISFALSNRDKILQNKQKIIQKILDSYRWEISSKKVLNLFIQS